MVEQLIKTIFSDLGWRYIYYGFIVGMLSGMVKIGWEAILPPRTQARNATNPPQKMLQQFGVPKSLTHAYILYSKDQKVFWFSLILHFTFSIFFAYIFVILTQVWPKVALWQGMAYGLVIWFAWHVVIMPALKTVPAAWQQPLAEHISEILGHMVWGWSIAASTYYLLAQTINRGGHLF